MQFSPERLDELASIRELADEYPSILTEHALRHLLRARDVNGLDACTVIIGRRWLIWRPGFVQWIKAQHAAQSGADGASEAA